VEALSTVALVMKALVDKLKTVEPNMHTVFDPQLDYESSINMVRANKPSQGNANNPTLPLLAFSRSSLRRQPDIGQRSARFAVNNLDKIAGTLDGYKVFRGEFDFRFVYFAKDISEIESFEIDYNSYEGFTKQTKITINIPNLGELDYFITWTFPLDDITLSKEGNYYKAISGSVKVDGWFISGKTTFPVIKQINSDIKLSNITIHTEITEND